MSTKKFTDLPNYPSGSVNPATDVLAIVDLASDESKKITVQDLGGVIGGGPTGSFMITGSVSGNILTFEKGDGDQFELAVTSSGTVGTLQEVTNSGSSTTNAITSSGIFINNGTDITPGTSSLGQLRILGNAYTGAVSMDVDAMYVGHNSLSRNLVLQTNEQPRIVILGSGTTIIRRSLQLPTAGIESFIAGSLSFKGSSTGTRWISLNRASATVGNIAQNDFIIGTDNNNKKFVFKQNGNLLISGSGESSIIAEGNITASGNISASGILSIPGFPNVSASLANATSGGSAAGTNGMIQLSDGTGGFKTGSNGQFFYDNTGGFVVGDGFGTYYISQSIATGVYLTLGDATDTNTTNKIRIPNGATSDPIEITGSLEVSGSITGSNLNVSGTGSIAYLQATETLVQYQTFCHNFIAGTSTMGAGDRPFIPWAGDDDLSSVPTRNTFLCPHSMTLKELKFSCEDVSGIVGTATIKVILSHTPDGSASEVQQATASFSLQSTDDQVVFTIPSSSFTGSVNFDSDKKILVSLQPDQNIQPSATTKDYYITTVWKETISTI